MLWRFIGGMGGGSGISLRVKTEGIRVGALKRFDDILETELRNESSAAVVASVICDAAVR